MSPTLGYLFLLSISALVAAGALINITVDDSSLNQLTELPFSYSPTTDWNFGPDCTKCAAHLDRSQVLDGTWHDATSGGTQGPQSATLGFNGSAVYVYGVVVTSPLVPSDVPSSTSLSFLIDDELVGAFNSTPVGNGSQPPEFQYNTLLYSNSSIPHGSHTFVLQNGLDGGPASIVLFDYLVYSIESDNVTSAASPSSTAVTVFPPPDATFPMGFPASGSDPLATILPAALVPSIVIFAAAISTILWRRRRGRARRQYASEMDLLGQLPPGVDLYVAHDDSAVGRMQHDDTPDIYSHPLQRMPSAGPSSLPMSPERLPSGKSRSHAVSQEPSSSSQLGRNPSLGGRSGIAGTEYPETLPPPYASEVGGEA